MSSHQYSSLPPVPVQGPCQRCFRRKAQRTWFLDPEKKMDLCRQCWCWWRKRPHVEMHMPVYKTFAEVDRTLNTGVYIRILGNPEPWWDGVYRIKNGGNNAQGYVWASRVFPGPFRAWGYQGARPRELRPWGRDMPPERFIEGIDDDECV